MKRSRLERKNPIRRGSTRLAAIGRRGKRRRQKGALFGDLSDFVRRKGCQARAWAPGPCSGDVQVCHARAGGRGDWIEEPGGGIVGNVFAGCYRHHTYSDLHKKECLAAMRAWAYTNGNAAIAKGIEPVL